MIKSNIPAESPPPAPEGHGEGANWPTDCVSVTAFRHNAAVALANASPPAPAQRRSGAPSFTDEEVEIAALAHVNAIRRCYGQAAVPLEWCWQEMAWAHQLTATRAALEAVATLIRAKAFEEAATVAEDEKEGFLSPQYAANQPFGSICERFACDEVAKAIRAHALEAVAKARGAALTPRPADAPEKKAVQP